MSSNNNDNDPISNLVNLLLEIFTKPDATNDNIEDNKKISDNTNNGTGPTNQLVNTTVDVLNEVKTDETTPAVETQTETNEKGQNAETNDKTAVTNANTEVDNGIPKMDDRKTVLVLFTITSTGSDSGTSVLQVKEYAYKVFQTAGEVAHVDAYLTTLKYNNKKAYSIPVVETQSNSQPPNNEGNTIQTMFSKMVKTATSFMSVPPYYYYLAVFNQEDAKKDDTKNSKSWEINKNSVMPILEKTYKELIGKGFTRGDQQTVPTDADGNKTVENKSKDVPTVKDEDEKNDINTANGEDEKVNAVRDATNTPNGGTSGKKSTVHKITRKRNQNKKVFTRKNIKRASSQK